MLLRVTTVKWKHFGGRFASRPDYGRRRGEEMRVRAPAAQRNILFFSILSFTFFSILSPMSSRPKSLKKQSRAEQHSAPDHKTLDGMTWLGTLSRTSHSEKHAIT